jgi:hypothetical protein
VSEAPKPLLALRAERAVLEKEIKSAVTWTLDEDEAQRLLDECVTVSECWTGALHRLQSKMFSDGHEAHSYGAQMVRKFKTACLAVARAEAAMVPRTAVPSHVDYAIRYQA